MQTINLPNSPLVPRLTLDVFLSRLVGIVAVEDSDDSDEELVPRMSDDAEPVDLVRGWGATLLDDSIIVSLLILFFGELAWLGTGELFFTIDESESSVMCRKRTAQNFEQQNFVSSTS